MLRKSGIFNGVNMPKKILHFFSLTLVFAILPLNSAGAAHCPAFKIRMGKMSRFVRLFVCAFALVFIGMNGSFAASCTSSKTYTSCKAGYYMTSSSSSTTCDTSQKTGNACRPCSVKGSNYTCAGGTSCPTIVYKLTLKANFPSAAPLKGGTFANSSKDAVVDCPSGKTITLDRPMRDGMWATGYQNLGWYTAASGGTIYTDNKVTCDGNKTIYAHWGKCPAGETNNTSNPYNSCATCPSGTGNQGSYSGSGYTATACTSCKPGSYAAASGSGCKACPEGSYNTGHGSTTCSVCSAGKTTNGTGKTSCTTCGNAGTYTNSSGTTSSAVSSWLTPTKSGTTTITMSNVCAINTCAANFTKQTYSSTTTPIYSGYCNANEYNLTLNYRGYSTTSSNPKTFIEYYAGCFSTDIQLACLSRGNTVTGMPTSTTTVSFKGFYNTSASTGGTQVLDASGKIMVDSTFFTYSSTLYARYDVTCAAGKYLPANSITCATCKQGYYCPGGTYTTHYSAQGRNACTSYSSTNSTGASSISACRCNSGYYGNAATSGGTCTKCPTLFPSKSAGNNGIDWCYYSASAGKYITPMPVTSSSAVKDCPAGYYCPGGTIYQDATTEKKTACPANTYRSATGGTSSSSCTACSSLGGGLYTSSLSASDSSTDCYLSVPAGKFLDVAPTDTALKTCAAGYYCPGVSKLYYPSAGGINACSKLGGGLYTISASGSTASTSCYASVPAGKQLTSYSSTAFSTPSGSWYTLAHNVYYSNTSSSSGNVKSCSTGFSTPNTTTQTDHDAAADCGITCNAGYYIPTAGGGCKVCTAGKYCTGGTKNQTETLAVTGSCPAGTYSTGGATSSACTAAVSGYTAAVCAANKYSDSGASSCTDCATAKGYTNSGTTAAAHAGIASCRTSCKGDQYVASAGAGCVTVGEGYYGREAAATSVAQNATLARTQCPTGYRNGAATTVEANCAMSVAGGKYVAVAKESAASGTCAAGYAKAAHTVTYGNTSSCAACTGATYAANTGQASCTTCPAATSLKSRVTGYGYWTSDNIHNTVNGCRATITEDDTRGNYTLSCAICDGDYGINTTCGGSSCMASTPQSCIGGYYWGAANSGNIWASSVENIKKVACIGVGVGYWSGANSLTRTQCATGLTTIGYGAGADEAADCGRVLHVGDTKLYLRSTKKTTPSLNVKIGNTTFYGNMSTATKGTLRINSGGTKYSVHDDSM